jgi:tRNA(fMet)-specific endonuclease VapC
MYVLDSNCLIHFFKKQGRVAEHLLATRPQDLALPAVALYELETGVAKSRDPVRNRAQLDEMVLRLVVLPFGPAEARTAGRLRAGLERRGASIGPVDILIAATALSHGGTLVTHNTREFERVAGLSIVDWY